MVDTKASPFDDASGRELIAWLARVGGPQFNLQEVQPAGSTIADATLVTPGIVTFNVASSAGQGFRLSKGALPGQFWFINSWFGADATNVYPPTADDQFFNLGLGNPVNLKGGWGAFYFVKSNLYHYFASLNSL